MFLRNWKDCYKAVTLETPFLNFKSTFFSMLIIALLMHLLFVFIYEMIIYSNECIKINLKKDNCWSAVKALQWSTEEPVPEM